MLGKDQSQPQNPECGSGGPTAMRMLISPKVEPVRNHENTRRVKVQGEVNKKLNVLGNTISMYSNKNVHLLNPIKAKFCLCCSRVMLPVTFSKVSVILITMEIYTFLVQLHYCLFPSRFFKFFLKVQNCC